MYNVILLTGVDDPLNPSKPLGAYKCAQVLRDAGYSCLVVDHIQTFTDSELKKLFDKIISNKTFLVGISNTFLPPEVINKIINLSPESVPVVVGGAKVRLNESNKNVSYSIIGYAENSLVNLANHLSKGQELLNSYRNIFGVTVIDDRAAKGYCFTSSYVNWLPEDVVNQQVLPLEVARGCVFKCKFCAYPMNGKQQLDFIKDEDVLVKEMLTNYTRYGIYKYFLVDDTFNDNAPKLKKLQAAIKKLPFKPEFWAYTRLDLIAKDTERNIDLLLDIGLRATHFGIETLKPDSGKLIGKGYSIEKQIDAVRYIRSQFKDTLLMHGSFIVGLPGESINDCKSTYQKLISQELPLHSWGFQPLVISNPNMFAWNSDISINFKDYGYNVTYTSDYWANWSNHDMDYATAITLATELNNLSSSSKTMSNYVTLAWASQTLGYDQDHLTASIQDVDFRVVALRKQMYIREYKEQLLNTIWAR